MFRTAFEKANASPEWQAGSLGWRSRELMVACPLEGIVRRSHHNSNKLRTFSPQAPLLEAVPDAFRLAKSVNILSSISP